MNKKITFVAVISAGSFLTACDSFRHTFGLDHYSADAFNVTENPSLCIPPDYNLTPPTPGAAQKGEQEASVKAHQKLFGQASSVSNKGSGTESTFLKTASQGKKVEGDIRETVNKEAEESGAMGKLKSMKDEAIRNLTGASAPDESNSE